MSKMLREHVVALQWDDPIYVTHTPEIVHQG